MDISLIPGGPENASVAGANDAQICQYLIDYYGGWEYVPATTAQAISDSCPWLFPAIMRSNSQGPVTSLPVDFISDQGDVGGLAPPSDEHPMVDTTQPDWTADLPVDQLPADSNSHPTIATDVPLWTSEPPQILVEGSPMLDDLTSPTLGATNLAGFFGDVIGTFVNGPNQSVGQDIEKLGRDLLPMFFQNDQINTGITATGKKPACKLNRRFKVSVDAQGNTSIVPAHPKIKMVGGKAQVVFGCPPRRMNPLNPRALGRAARRMAGFHRIASHIEKVIQHACKSKRRSAPRMSYGKSCGTKRCR